MSEDSAYYHYEKYVAKSYAVVVGVGLSVGLLDGTY